MNLNPIVLFEISWEVCNQVGGIHTVLRSKLPQVKKAFGDHYFLVGPQHDVNPEFEEDPDDLSANVQRKLESAGLPVLVGRWKGPERPRVILVRYKDILDQEKLFYELWQDFGVDSMTGAWDYIEPVLFATMAGKVVRSCAELFGDRIPVAHFHEWVSGAGLLHLKKNAPHITTVFTAHATVLGRSMAGSGMDSCRALSDINTDSLADRLNVTAKHTLETACAREADAFTTISEIMAFEASHILHERPDQVLFSGFNARAVPDAAADNGLFLKNRGKLLEFARRFLKKDLPEDKTVLLCTSGRYEYHNKGLDLLLDVLAAIKREPRNAEYEVVSFLLMTGPNLKNSADMPREQHGLKIATHALWDPAGDPVIRTCLEKGLSNASGDPVNVIFIPVCLDGADGALNIPYYDALSGFDIAVYPSCYEPWGTGPLESIAFSLPTITSDRSGFGQWVLDQGLESRGLQVLRRLEKGEEQVRQNLRDMLLPLIEMDPAGRNALRPALRKAALRADWERVYPRYLKAYREACRQCSDRAQGRDEKEKQKKKYEILNYRGADSPRPRFRQISVKASLPPALKGLRDLAYNLWWSWTPEARDLFSRLDPVLYESVSNNPVTLLEIVDPKKLTAMSANEDYLRLYENVLKMLSVYRDNTDTALPALGPVSRDCPVAYFSMEFGLHECLPVYSGGLGVLSGDHIKSSSDLNIPLLGIGLLYKNGYFRQRVSEENGQTVEYVHNDFFRMPLKEVRINRERLTVGIAFPGRIVYARVWEARVGRVPLYFLDSDVQENSGSDRGITAKLYGGGKRMRIEQEILLGIGGVRLLQEMNIHPCVYHLNEGHSAFLLLERLIHLTRYHKLDIDTALEVVRSSTVFTTHTPVPAGNETFDMELVGNYLKSYVDTNKVPWRFFNELGHQHSVASGPYEMTVLALKASHRRNGVSKLHGLVSRNMWSNLWPGSLVEEIPIGHITNGVHVPTWIAPEMKELLTRYCALNLNDDLLKSGVWNKIEKVPDEIVWQTHHGLKNQLIGLVKSRIIRQWTREGEDPSLIETFNNRFNAAPLTIGFARRIAAYKRPTLIFKDMARLEKLLQDTGQPVQIVFAGKAHPEDKAAHEYIRQIAAMAKQDAFIGKIVFVEDYDMKAARHLVAGVDVWLNNPRRPMEASGTSGQKAGLNGVVNFSVLDGWWDEAFDGTNGWAIGGRNEYRNAEQQDLVDSESLYETLENEIIPMYYARSGGGVPEKWIQRMKRSMITTIAAYNTHRMLRDYMEQMYIPAAIKGRSRTADNFARGRGVAEWKRSMRARFSSLHINGVSVEGVDSDILNVGDKMTVTLELQKGRVTGDELLAQIVISEDARIDTDKVFGTQAIFNEPLQHIEMKKMHEDEQVIRYRGVITARKSGKINYGVRLMPFHAEVENLADLNLVYWG